ncbi:Rho termination factor N-terminal domain-containing protein, partial [Nocardia sp. NPDC004582]
MDSDPASSGSRESDSGQISKMSEQTDVARSGLTGMLLPQLRALAGELGIRGTSGMRKGDLIAAIKENQVGATKAPATGGGKTAGKAKAKAEDAPTGGESVSAVDTESVKKSARSADAALAEAKTETKTDRAEKAESRQNASETRESKSAESREAKREEGETARAEGGEDTPRSTRPWCWARTGPWTCRRCWTSRT